MYDSTAQRVYLKISASNFKRSEIMPVCAASNARPRIRLITHGERILPGICSDRSIRYTWTPAIERTNKTINSLLSLKYYHSHVGCTWNHNIFVFFFRTYLFHNLTVSTVATEAQTAAYSNYLPAIVCDAEFALVWHSFFVFFCYSQRKIQSKPKFDVKNLNWARCRLSVVCCLFDGRFRYDLILNVGFGYIFCTVKWRLAFAVATMHATLMRFF